VSVAEFRRPDHADRATIVTDLDANLLVEAAAGTGKTTSLVDRMIALIRQGGVPVERLCAVTFTVKAAAQLKEKFQLRLEASLRGVTDRLVGERFAGALAGLDRCFVGTIHAFCARLLRERPVEARVDPEFEELDETEDLLLREEAWERYKQMLFVQARPILPELAKYGIPIELLREAYECLAGNPDVSLAVSSRTAEPRFDRERKKVLEFLERARPDLAEPPTDPKPDELRKKLESALRFVELFDLDRTTELVRLIDRLDNKGKVVASRWKDPARARKLENDFQTLRDDVITPALSRWREFLYPIVVEAVRPAAEEFARLRRERGALDFNDLLLDARNLLRDHAPVRREFQKRFTPILVDEFQDTDPIQAEILLYLTGADHDEKDWRKLEPVPGSLFVVGDPKQSIYRFRRADIETYERVRERIVASGGKVVSLTTNFRSCPEICEWVNGVFDGVFPEAASREQAGNAPLHAERPSAGGISGAYRLETPAAGRRHEDVARADAVRIASWIRSALDSRIEIAREGSRAAEPRDFLLLFRLKKRMNLYARELEARGIPYEIAGGGAFSESEDLQDFLPVLESVADPDDAVSLVAALRGRFFGVDDDALYRFRRARGRFHLFAPLPADADPRIVRAIGLLRDAHRVSRDLPPGAALAKIAESIGAIASAGSQELGGTRAGNLLKAVAIARSLSAAGEPYEAIVRRLRELAEKSDTEEMSTRPGESHAVRLMTLHRAKGLEAPIVFLADPTGERDKPVAWCVEREVDPPRAWLRIIRKEGFQDHEIARPEGWPQREEAEEKFVEAEKDRLLYVAATRAADVLVVSVGTSAAKSPWAKLAAEITRELPSLPSRPAAAEPTVSKTNAAAELGDFRRRRDSRVAAAGRPSYSVSQVTTVSHSASGGTPFRERTGRGMSWGRVLHRLLDAAMKDPSTDLTQTAVNLLSEEDRPASDLDGMLTLARSVIASSLWRRALAAGRRLTEVPFALMTRSADLGVSGGPDETLDETLLQGAIDLAFEEESGWVLVDYKSDTIAGNLQELVDFYSPQIRMYRDYWEKLTGRPTKAGLYFVSTGEEVWPPLSEPPSR
jgi:ATP-dependent helicase/nuclease subunit A